MPAARDPLDLSVFPPRDSDVISQLWGRSWVLTLAVGLFLTVVVCPGVLLANCPGGTVIYSYTPQAGIAGVTRVYIIGACFGASQGTGTVSIGGVPVSSIFLWSDGEIGLELPFTAQTGTLEVDSQDYGSDTSTNEANGNNWGWSGNGQISGVFTVYSPNYPPFYNSSTGFNKVDPLGPSIPQYVEGIWSYDYGGWETAEYTLAQGSRTTDGTYPIWGNVAWTADPTYNADCSQALTGTLDTQGKLILNVADGGSGCGAYSEEWVILNSGDATSQGWFWEPQSNPGWCTPPSTFPNGLGYSCSDVPLFKTQTDIPTTEAPGFLGWVADPGSDATYGAWQRSLPISGDGFVEYAGRFVFEQNAPGGMSVDVCYDAANGGSPYQRFGSVSGGGWYVNGNGIWGSGRALDGTTNLLLSDYIGIPSIAVQWYQQHVSQCSITLYQTMFIDSVNGAESYNAGGPNGSTNQLEIDINSQPQVCTLVTPTAATPGTPVCKDYP